MYELEKDAFPLRPRERLLAYGAEQLSEQELLAILLRTGTKTEDVFTLSGRLLDKFKTLCDFRSASLIELCEISGIGKVKAIELKAMIELGKRIQADSKMPLGEVFGSSTFAKQMMVEMANLRQEHLVAIYLDNRNRILQKKTIFIGTVNSSLATPREILHYAVKILATCILVVHNHPSGNVEPSSADKEFTKKLALACQAMGTDLVDHLIVGQKDYFSFREEKMF